MNYIDFLKELVKIKSGSNNKKGVDEVGNKLIEKYLNFGFELERYKSEEYGDLLHLKSSKNKGVKILLSGHMDTVFEENSGFCGCEEDENYLYGPGTNDMKGGLVTMLYAIDKLYQTQGEVTNIDILLSPTEEIGTKGFTQILLDIAQDYHYVFVFEGAGEKYEFCNARRGISKVKIQAVGKAGHAGKFSQIYPSAIEKISNAISQIYKLPDKNKGLTMNIGKIEGGEKMNIICDRAYAEGEIRYQDKDYYQKILDRLKEIENDFVKIDIEEFGPAWSTNLATKNFMEEMVKVGQEIGEEVKFHERLSSSEANYFSQIDNIVVIDGFGTVGEGIHTNSEKMKKSSLKKRGEYLYYLLMFLNREYGKS